MKLSLFLMLFSFGAMAQDYVLSQTENHHYQDYTRAELIARLGEASATLPQYACDGKKEFDMFWKAPNENTKGDSLKVQLRGTQEVVTYKKGVYRDAKGKKFTDFSDEFFGHVKVAIAKIEKKREGRKMLRMLERGQYPMTIKYGLFQMVASISDDGRIYQGVYAATALSVLDHGRFTNENVRFQNIGAAGNIVWNPTAKDIPAEASLAHEMFHALDVVRGIIDMREVRGENYEPAMLSEYRGVYMENLFRKAAGAPIRRYYGKTQKGPDLLDEHGHVHKMPWPCLKEK